MPLLSWGAMARSIYETYLERQRGKKRCEEKNKAKAPTGWTWCSKGKEQKTN